MPDELPQPDCITAFMVVQGTDGGWYATPQLTPLTPARNATVQDMKAGCGDVVEDIYAAKVAHVVLERMVATTRQIQEAQQATDLASRLKI